MGTRDEVAQHGLGDVEVGDDSVAQRAHRADGARRASEHLLGFLADGQNALPTPRVGLDGDDGGLARNDATTLHVNQRGSRAEVDREVVREEAVEPVGDHGYQMDSRSEFPTISKGFRVQAGWM